MEDAIAERRSYFRWDPWLPLGLAVVALVLQVEPWWRPSPDGVQYLSVSRSLWQTGTLRALGEERLHQAPGYAVVLAPLWGLAGGEVSRVFGWVAVLHFALGVVYLGLVYRWMRHRVSVVAAGRLAALTVVNAGYFEAHRRVLSEPLFGVLLVGGVLLVERYVRAGGDGRAGWRGYTALLAGAGLLTAAAMTRTVGAVWWLGVAALVVVGLRERRHGWRWWAAAGERRRAAVTAALVGVAVALAVGGWGVRERAAAGAETVETQMSILAEAATTDGLAERTAREALVRVRNAGQLLVPGMLGSGGERLVDVNLLVFGPVVLAVLYGWWRHGGAAGGPGSGVPHGGGVLAWGGLAVVVLLVVAWPHSEGVRYLLPVLPVLWLGLYWAMPRGWMQRNRREHVLGVALCLHLAAALIFQQADRAEAREFHARWPGLTALVEPARGLERAQNHLVEMTGEIKPAVRLLLDREVDHMAVEEFSRVAPPHRPRYAFIPEEKPLPRGWAVDATGGGLRRLTPVPVDGVTDP